MNKVVNWGHKRCHCQDLCAFVVVVALCFASRWLCGRQEWWQVFHVPLIIPGGYLRRLPPAVQRQSVALSGIDSSHSLSTLVFVPFGNFVFASCRLDYYIRPNL
ncbi:hypothetical protein AMECASPLE_031775 [Ameca splendens]|uniref:Secreted protein n=1 Tax=Ameca splendens TaxID=208324 RepID=A0ABV0XVM0_9TELE